MSELPMGWELVAFPDFVFFQEGPGLRKYQYREVGIPFLNIRTFDDETINKTLCGFLDPKDVEEKYQHFLVDEDDILVAISGSIGKMAIARLEDLPLMLNTSIMRFRPLYEDALLRRYIYFFLKSEHFFKQAEKAWTGTAQKNMGPSHIKKFKLLLPPLNEQRRIVAKLDRLFARSRCAREELGRVSGLVQRYKQAVLTAATSGHLTEEWRQNNNCLVWERKSLEDVANIVDPHPSHRTPKESPDGIPYVGIGDLDQSGNFDFVNARKVSRDILKEHQERYTLNEGDFIFGKIGTLGKVTRLPLTYEYTLSANVILIQPDANLVEPRYLMFFLQAPETMNEIASQSNSTSQAAFGIKKMRAFKFLMPNLREQIEIISRVEKAFKTIYLIEQEHQKASKLLDRLEQATLSKAFRGELVTQDPNDEPAAVLLERIQSDRQAQPKGKAIKSKQSHR